MLNRIIISGRLTADPTLRYTTQNVPVTSFTVAVERDRKNTDGSKTTDFLDVQVWRQSAEFISKYGSKGAMVTIDGSLQTRSWKDKDGGNRKAIEIIAENVYLSDSKRVSDEQASQNFANLAARAQDDETDAFLELADDSNLPFG